MKDSDNNAGKNHELLQCTRAAMSAGEMSEEDTQHLIQTQMSSRHNHLDSELIQNKGRDMSNSIFHWPCRVYYEDTDSGGVVYYANYLKYMERARTEWLRSFGLEQDKLIKDQGVIFAVRSVNVDYLKPARFNQLLSVSAEIFEFGKASITFSQEVSVDNSSVDSPGEVLCQGQIKIACLDAISMKPQAIPQIVRDALPIE